MRYNVPIIFRGQNNFIIEAKSPEEAKKKAEAKFNNGDEPDELGNEWQYIISICDPEPLKNE